jgi:hypothetical protein
MEPVPKKRRVLAVAKRAGVSDSALARVLESLVEEPVPARLSRKDIAKEELDFLNTETPYGKPTHTIDLPLIGGSCFAWHICNPFAMLWWFCRVSPSFSELVSRVHGRLPSTPQRPWNMVLYQDEVTPGNLLRVDNTRKVMVWYFSFAELGLDVLFKESAWFVLAIISTKVASQVIGGFGAVFKALVGQFFRSDFNLSSGGVTLPCMPPTVLFSKFGFNVADEAALKQMWGFKGASGTRPCLFCKSVVDPRGNLEAFDPDGYL